MWSKNGKRLQTLDSFIEFVNGVNFDMTECLYDDQNIAIESKKTIRKLYDRSKYFVDYVFTDEKIDKV